MLRSKPVPASIGAFRIVRRLRVGGPAATYLARGGSGADEHTVAIEIVPLPTGTDVAAAAREAAGITRVDHASVTRTVETFPWNGCVAVVTSYASGATLGRVRDHLAADDGERLSDQAVAAIGRALAAALAAAHEATDDDGAPAPVLHGALSPERVLIRPNGRAMLSGFGVGPARGFALDRADPAATYAAPEILHGQRVTPRSDTYALGRLLWGLFTGLSSEPGEGVATLASLRSELPDDLAEAIDAALEPAAARRRVTCWELEHDLGRGLDLEAAERELAKLVASVLELRPQAARGEPMRRLALRDIRPAQRVRAGFLRPPQRRSLAATTPATGPVADGPRPAPPSPPEPPAAPRSPSSPPRPRLRSSAALHELFAVEGAASEVKPQPTPVVPNDAPRPSAPPASAAEGEQAARPSDEAAAGGAVEEAIGEESVASIEAMARLAEPAPTTPEPVHEEAAVEGAAAPPAADTSGLGGLLDDDDDVSEPAVRGPASSGARSQSDGAASGQGAGEERGAPATNGETPTSPAASELAPTPLTLRAMVALAAGTAALVLGAGMLVAERDLEPHERTTGAASSATAARSSAPKKGPTAPARPHGTTVETAPATSTGALTAPRPPVLAREPDTAAPAPGPDASALAPVLGYLTVRTSAKGDVYVNGKPVGPANRRLEALCGTRYVRVGARVAPEEVRWLTAGQTVELGCRTATTLSLQALPPP